jgi:hypothetical protein
MRMVSAHGDRHPLNPTASAGRDAMSALHAPRNGFLTLFLSVLPSTSAPSEERPTKRARVSSSKNRGNVRTGLSKRVRGRLSELPTMPLDIVYEVRDASFLA